MSDYARVEKVIRYLDENHPAQPSLAELAAACGLSESHFHRLFHRWAGATPKDFIQCLTVEHAKRRLRESASVLDAALDAGLSGPGRLHDLLVTLEAATPGEIKSGGSGMTIEWGVATTPFGNCTLGWSPRGICHLEFHDSDNIAATPPEILASWPNATLQRNDREATRHAKAIFDPGTLSSVPLRAFVRGTPFQLKVWRALLRIPEGCMASYRTIARAVGHPDATRAVGTACGSNPVGYLIPCHRVIRETGIVKGYRWGHARKQALLAREGVTVLSRDPSAVTPACA